MKAVVNAVRARAAGFWLARLFWLARRATWVLRMLKPLGVWGAWQAPGLRHATIANARWLLGPASTEKQRRALGKAVVANFYDAVLEFGANRTAPPDQLLSRLGAVEGEAAYDTARAHRRGAVLVTAHLGCFETAIAMLARKERRIHVVFKRDASPTFERLRTEQHARLGVLEAPTDDGLGMWIRMRDALKNDEVVLIQGDRTPPGESGRIVPFLGGHIRLPTGPVKLARIAGAPIVPAFAVRSQDGKVLIMLGQPIWPGDSPEPGAPDPALLQIAAAIEDCVRRYPSQWLVLHRAWCEDEPAPSTPGN